MEMHTSPLCLLVLAAASLLQCLPPTQGQIMQMGACPSGVKVVENFNISEYMGKWYEIRRYPAMFQDGICATAEYTFNAGNSTVQVLNTMYDRDTLKKSMQLGEARPDPLAGMNNAKLKVEFNLGNGIVTSGDYWVLATNYKSYAVVWSCQLNILKGYNEQYAWILSRSKELSTTDNALAIKTLKDNKIATYFLTPKDRHDCNAASSLSSQTLLMLVVSAFSLILAGPYKS